MAQEIAIYYDASRCSACKGCQINCMQWNQLPSAYELEDTPFSGSFQNPVKNDGDTWLHIGFQEGEDSKGNWYWAFGRSACQHCTDAACVEVCPTGACHHLPNGAVVIDKDTCIGCEYCVAACPFDIPVYNNRESVKATRKCWLCQDRITNGREPACVSTCPTDALLFGDRDEMIAKAHETLDRIKPNFPDAVVYGEHEMGGLHVIQVLPFGAEAAGLPAKPKKSLATNVTQLIKPALGVAAVGVLGLTAAAFIAGRGTERGVDDIQYDIEKGVITNKGEFYDKADEVTAKEVVEGGSND